MKQGEPEKPPRRPENNDIVQESRISALASHWAFKIVGRSVAEKLTRLSTGWVVAAISLLSALSVAILIFAGSLGTGFWSLFWSALGSAVLSTALALLISEIILKPVLVRDLLSMTRLRDRVEEIALRDLGPSVRVPWSDLYSAAREIDLLIDAPAAWIERDLDRVIACAGRRSRVRVFLPSPESALAVQVNAAEAHLREAWERRQNKDSKAELEIWFLEDQPDSFMARFDDEIVVAIDAGLRSEAKSTVYLHVRADGDSDVQTWLRDRWQWADNHSATPAWQSPKPRVRTRDIRGRLGTKLDAVKEDK
ncbi:hypothetical protein [Microbacterium testaceum]|uniref:hypothetical protein n=1 Tax=Microbacterium testaceum TaxID=2033 RepID=UPI0011AF2236|nr:hypothetical protein [Microbacterium testaceum]